MARASAWTVIPMCKLLLPWCQARSCCTFCRCASCAAVVGRRFWGARRAPLELRTKSHARPARRPERGVRGRVNQLLIGGQMSTEILFQIHLVLGYVAWLLCFGVYVWPRLKSMTPLDAQRAIATLHSFRFFGLVFILPGVVGPNLPRSFAAFVGYWDLATGVPASLALLA